MTLDGRDATVQVRARDFPTNRGGLCQKGWTAAYLLAPGERLTAPLMRARRDGPLLPVSWDTALDRVAREFRRAQARYGRDSVGVFGGGGLTNEKAYWLGKFARVALRSASIDYNGRFCMSSAAAAATRAFGLDRGLPFPLPDLAAADVILLAGSNAAETMPPFSRWLADQQAGGGAVLIGGEQVAVFRAFDGSLYALGNQDPYSGAFVLSRGIVGTRDDIPTVASPLHKQVFDLRTGACLDGGSARVPVFPVRQRDGHVEVEVIAR